MPTLTERDRRLLDRPRRDWPETSPLHLAAEIQPTLLPVSKNTWLELASMGVDVSAGRYEFLDDGWDVSSIVRQDYGWWRMEAIGWFPYTELRDVHTHERTGMGRPWLNKLPTKWQDLIFRELILLVLTWNEVVDPSQRWHMGPVRVGQEVPEWMQYWLTLTNSAWRSGAFKYAEAALDSRGWHGAEEADEVFQRLLEQYLSSESTWRPMMPESAEYHRKYGQRPATWSFRRGEY